MLEHELDKVTKVASLPIHIFIERAGRMLTCNKTNENMLR